MKDAHVSLDAVVLAAYGFSPKQALLAQLLELNLAVTAPGVPPAYGDRAPLITGDRIRP